MIEVDPLLPGADLVATGINDLSRNRESPEALLVSMAATKLRSLGFDIPPGFPDPEHRLWCLLAETDSDSAHGRYNALVRRLISFQRACAN